MPAQSDSAIGQHLLSNPQMGPGLSRWTVPDYGTCVYWSTFRWSWSHIYTHTNSCSLQTKRVCAYTASVLTWTHRKIMGGHGFPRCLKAMKCMFMSVPVQRTNPQLSEQINCFFLCLHFRYSSVCPDELPEERRQQCLFFFSAILFYFCHRSILPMRNLKDYMAFQYVLGS